MIFSNHFTHHTTVQEDLRNVLLKTLPNQDTKRLIIITKTVYLVIQKQSGVGKLGTGKKKSFNIISVGKVGSPAKWQLTKPIFVV